MVPDVSEILTQLDVLKSRKKRVCYLYEEHLTCVLNKTHPSFINLGSEKFVFVACQVLYMAMLYLRNLKTKYLFRLVLYLLGLTPAKIIFAL